MSSYQSLENKLGFNKALPVTENWSAAPDFLEIISDYCLLKEPQVIVECSSGTSSLVLSQCCRINKAGHVYSLENGEDFAVQTSRHLDEFLLSEICDVIHAPLRDVQLENDTFQWYDVSRLPGLVIDMLVIDGPPGFLQRHSRYPALPVLKEYLGEHCAVFLDDAARDDEQELVSHWLKKNQDFQGEYIESERGCFVLTR